MKRKIVSILLAAAMLLSALTVTAFADGEELAFAGALGNDMVLQRDAEINIWGTGRKGATVTVKFKDASVSTTVGDDGKWLVKLPKQEKDKNENTLTAASESETVTLTGVLVGDVYLLGGQSNAEKTLSACGKEYSTEMKKAMIEKNDGMIRYFTQGRDAAKAKKAYMETPQENPIKGKKWKKETVATAASFSAMGFFFAHKIATEADVPVGVIMVASSGSPVSQLMSAEAVKKSGYTRYENDIPVSGMYNALMNPFINMTIKGMLYYQGESEQGLAKSDYGKYNEYVNIYVEDLREKMNQNFPFYYVQLSSHAGDGLKSWSGIGQQRAVQFDGLKVIKNSGMVVSMDMGYLPGQTDWAHPDRKQPVGERLAALTLARDYNIGTEENNTSPMPEYAYKSDGGVVIHFTHVAGGLKKLGSQSEILGFKLIFANNLTRDAKAEILNENEVFLETDLLSQLKGVGYGLEELAFTDYNGETKYIANLGNGSDLPAPTFMLREILDAKPEPTNAGTGTPAADGTVTPAADGTTETAAPNQTPAGAEGKKSNLPVILGCIGGAVVIAGVVVTLTVLKKKEKSEN